MNRESGVDKKLYKEYKFEDHIWSGSNNALISRLGELREFIVLVNDEYWLFNPKLKRWKSFVGTKAQQEAKNTLISLVLPTGTVIDEALIMTYFTGMPHHMVNNVCDKTKNGNFIGNCPQLDGVMALPLAPAFVVFDNMRFLNVWRDTGILGDEDNLVYGKMLLRLIYRSLCNGERLHSHPLTEADMLLAQVDSDNYTNPDFEFVMHYLAGIYQRPGINLTTNLWFVGTLEGTGKGTLIYIMQVILGYNVVGQLSGEEISKRGWSDHLMAKQLIEVNEFDQGDSFDWLSWIKRNCNEPFILISKRGSTPITVINTANYLFSLNPKKGQNIITGITANDRRNHMVETTTDKQWVGHASAIRGDAVVKPLEYASGFAAILARVKFNPKIVRYSFVNDYKRRLIESQADPISVWLQNDKSFTLGIDYTSQQLYIDHYKKWAGTYADKILSHQMWGRYMKSHACVEESTRQNVVYYKLRAQPDEQKIDWALVQEDFDGFGLNQQVQPQETAEPTVFIPERSKIDVVREALKQLDKYPSYPSLTGEDYE